MFRLYDARASQMAEIDPGPGRLLRIYARGPAAHATELRSLLVADLIRRNAEHRHNVSVLGCLVGPDDDAFRAEATALNLRAAEQTVPAAEAIGPAIGAIAPGEIIIDAGEAGRHLVRAGQVLFGGGETAGSVPDAAPAARPSDLAARGLDPLALRLALLGHRHAEPVTLTWDALAEADQTLQRWRGLVAEWAESPSKPMCAEVTAQVGAAFDDDLDTPAALRALDRLAQDPGIPPGSKFESFVHADQLLALDLPREIGRPRRG